MSADALIDDNQRKRSVERHRRFTEHFEKYPEPSGYVEIRSWHLGTGWLAMHRDLQEIANHPACRAWTPYQQLVLERARDFNLFRYLSPAATTEKLGAGSDELPDWWDLVPEVDQLNVLRDELRARGVDAVLEQWDRAVKKSVTEYLAKPHHNLSWWTLADWNDPREREQGASESSVSHYFVAASTDPGDAIDRIKRSREGWARIPDHLAFPKTNKARTFELSWATYLCRRQRKLTPLNSPLRSNKKRTRRSNKRQRALEVMHQREFRSWLTQCGSMREFAELECKTWAEARKAQQEVGDSIRYLFPHANIPTDVKFVSLQEDKSSAAEMEAHDEIPKDLRHRYTPPELVKSSTAEQAYDELLYDLRNQLKPQEFVSAYEAITGDVHLATLRGHAQQIGFPLDYDFEIVDQAWKTEKRRHCKQEEHEQFIFDTLDIARGRLKYGKLWRSRAKRTPPILKWHISWEWWTKEALKLWGRPSTEVERVRRLLDQRREVRSEGPILEALRDGYLLSDLVHWPEYRVSRRRDGMRSLKRALVRELKQFAARQNEVTRKKNL